MTRKSDHLGYALTTERGHDAFAKSWKKMTNILSTKTNMKT